MLRLTLYPLRKTRQGRKRGEFPVGSVCWDGEKVVVDCPDKSLKHKLKQHFSATILVRRPRGSLETVLAYAWEEVASGTEEHFRESLRRLKSLGVIAVEELG